MASTGLFSAIGAVFKGLRASLTRSGVNVGGTADYPRIEIHSITESEWLDKGSIKRITAVVECISNKRMTDVLEMNEANLARILGDKLMLSEGWKVSGVVTGQAQELTETSDTNAIIYRLMQNVTIYVER
jgi:hypothetical protein